MIHFKAIYLPLVILALERRNGCQAFTSPSSCVTIAPPKIIYNLAQLQQNTPKHFDVPTRTSLHMSSSLGAGSSIFASISQTLSLFSGSTPLGTITEVLSTTPPMAYFFCLVAAGFGIPISEDAMIIFAGTILPTIWTQDVMKRNKLILALYAGIVISDMITFTIGRTLRMGVLEPFRKRMDLRAERVLFCDDDVEVDLEMEMEMELIPDEFCELETPTARKRDKILAKLESAGNYAGFVTRFSVGFRAPMMIAAGFSGKVPYLTYFLGTSVGALCSLSSQLLLGYTMRNNPTAVVGAVASISTFAAVVPLTIAFVGWVSLMWSRYQLRERI